MKLNENYKRVVIKIGSSILTDKNNHLDKQLIKNIVRQLSCLVDEGREVILVCSGAIACGLDILNYSKRPKDLVELSALASIGQIALMKSFQEAFSQFNKNCAQILLTWDDFDSRKRFLNAKKTINKLLEHKVVPIINENDAVSTQEIKFGDNDKLSALLANLVSSDILIILTDVDGLFDRKNNRLVKCVERVDPDVTRLACGSEKFTCVGGMYTKLEAIKIANQAGIGGVLANGRTQGVLLSIMQGDNIGTFFCAGNKRLARKNWIASGAKSKGVIIVDDGAKEAITIKNKSLLCVGIIGSRGAFKENDIVYISDKNGNNFAKGIANFSSTSINEAKGKKGAREAVHRDDLVII